MHPTDKFRRALAPAVFAASPPLAALHAARTRLLPPHPPQDSSACSTCGSFLLHRSTLRPRRSPRLHRRSCPICGSATLSPLPATPFPQTRHQSSAPSLPQQITTPPPPLPHPPAASKPRPKNKPGLQHLLARNRKNQQKEHKQGHESGQLAAFLTGL